MSDPSPIERPRVTVVEPVGRGGLIHYAYQLCEALVDEELEVTLITATGYELRDLPHRFRIEPSMRLWDPKPAADGPATGVKRALRRLVRAGRYVREWARLVRRLRQHPPDILQLGDLRFAGDALWVRALSRGESVLVDICHNVAPFRGGGGGRDFRAGPLSRLAYRQAYRRFDRVFVHHDSNRKRFLERYDVDPDRVRAIPHGNHELMRRIDEGLPAEGVRRSLGIPPEAPVVLSVGTLSAYKGIDLLIRAAARLAGPRPETHWVVAGYPLPGFDVEEHRRLARELGVPDRFHLEPRYLDNGELGAWLRMADLVALPYREGFNSGVLRIAQSFGKPVVAASVGNFPEALEEGVEGLLHRPGDPDALASAIGRILGDEELRRRMGEAARALSRGRRSWHRVARMLAREYRVLLAERNGRCDGARRREGVPA